MSRGYSLEHDLKLLLNNPKFSDIEILCKDKKKLYGCRAILAARSEVFEGLLYSGMKESYEKQISFPEISSFGMEIVLEYTYTGSVKVKSLTIDNIIEACYVADFFHLPGLQTCIVETVEKILEKNYAENYSPELLSKVVETMPLTEDNALLNLLVETVATTPLNTIEFGRLSMAAFKYLLSCTHEKKKLFATPEYEVFRYGVILTAKQISNDAYKALMERMPTLKQIESPIIQIDNNKFIADHQKVVQELESLTKFIDFRRIEGQIFVDIIEPLEIIPEIVLNFYRNIAKSNKSINTRGIPSFNYKTSYVWNESTPECIFTDNGHVVQTSSDRLRNSRAKMILDNKCIINEGIFEWDVTIERKKYYTDCYVGVCASENFNYGICAGYQSTGWVLCNSGKCWNSSNELDYCPNFEEHLTKITVHLDMNKRTLAFTVNGTKYPEVSGWNNLPSKLYPVVSLRIDTKIRIEPHQKG